jgi:sugar phosphate isomerase/epimerase
VLDLIAAIGLEGVSLAFIGGVSAEPPNLIAADPEGNADRIAAALDDRGLAPADVFLIPDGGLIDGTVNHLDPRQDAASRELFARFLRFASRIGSTGITILPGVVFGGESRDEAIARSASRLRDRLEMARDHGLRLSVEPHIVTLDPYRGSVIDTPARVAQLLEAAPGLELTLDYGHFNVQGIADREVEPLIGHARHFHMRGGAPGLVQTRFEDNVTDFGRVLDVMAETGYDGWVEIEYVYDERPGCQDCDNLQEVRRFAGFVESRRMGKESPWRRQGFDTDSDVC